MRIGICAGPDAAAHAAAAGADYLEVHCQQSFVPQDEDDAAFVPVRRQLDALPLPAANANCFLPGELPCVGRRADIPAIVAYGRRAFARAQAVGCRHIVFGSGGARRLDDGQDHAAGIEQFVATCRALAPVAEEHDVVLVIEPLNSSECNLITSIPEGAEVVRAVDHPNIRLLVDCYHMLHDDQGPEELDGHIELVAHCHVAERDGRTPPGVHGEDFRPYLARLHAGGYRGDVSIEGQWDDLPAQASTAVAELRRQVADAIG